MSEHKRKMNKKSLENLQPEKYYFTSDSAQIAQKKSVIKRKENKTLEEVKNEIVQKCFSKINDLLEKEEISSADLRDIFKTAVDMSGFKKQSQDINIEAPNINIEGLNI